MLRRPRSVLATACFASLLLFSGCMESRFDDGATTRLLESASCSGISTVSAGLYCQYAANISRVDLIGSGTSASPYEICSPYQLQNIGSNATYMSKSFKLTADLDMSCIAGNHTRIGSTSAPFTGEWDGNDKAIDNWKYSDATADDVGLFAYARNARIYELSMNGAAVTGKDYVGIAVGRAESSHLLQIATAGTVTGTNDVGGVVGRASTGAVNQASSSALVNGASGVGGVVGNGELPIVVSSFFTGTVSATGTNVGGVIGNSTTGFISNSYSTGSVSSTGAQVGGVAGVTGEIVKNTYSTGAVSGTTSVGGIVGRLLSTSSLTNSFSVSSVTGSGGSSANVGRLVGTQTGTTSNTHFWTGASCDADSATVGTQACNVVAAGSQTTASSFYSATTAPISSWDFQNESASGTMDEWSTVTNGYPAAWFISPSNTGIPFFDGNGTTTDPYLISSISQYNLISANPRWMGSHFKLTANLSFGATAAKQIGSIQSPFYGTIDGNGKTLSSVNVSGTTVVGVVGLMIHPGRISNLSIAGATITGDSYTGGLVGFSTGELSGVTFAGTMTVGRSSGGLVGSAAWPATISAGTVAAVIEASTLSSSVGGLVGRASGAVITKSLAASTLVGGSQYVGGLVGLLSGGTISNSYTTGDYGIATANEVGGLVGYQTSSAVVSNSYSGATLVTGLESVGGLVGKTDSGTTVSACFSTSDATGDTATTLVGLLVGSHAGTATNSYAIGTCTPGTGACNTLGFTAAGAVSDFHTSTNAPLSSWNFTTIWRSTGAALPTHR